MVDTKQVVGLDIEAKRTFFIVSAGRALAAPGNDAAGYAVNNAIGDCIKKRREELRLTQADLGKALGYRYGNFVGYLENGKAVFPLDKWEEYAAVLQIAKHQFLRIVLQDKFPSMLPYLDFHPASQDETEAPADKTQSA